ncbi:hypothetical protein VNI00_017133 [Paramarasmius palmivorus]|uniref:Uncharacterized protein n=1 Tax=Paramarasmius palmivorus TaxID=297713 RepID=A0AAW0B908_9AGAR
MPMDYDFIVPTSEAKAAQASTKQDTEDSDVWEDIDILNMADDSLKECRYQDPRTRRNQIQTEQQHWIPQIPEMADAFLDYNYCKWELNEAEYDGVVETTEWVEVMDTFNAVRMGAKYYRGMLKSTSLVRQGMIPCSPLLHVRAVTISVLELYYHLSCRCPRLAIQPFVRGLCDLQGFPYRDTLSDQFSRAYDCYLAIQRELHQRVQKRLKHDTERWQMLNNCPCCQYPVENEPELEIGTLVCFDGNDSMKRVQRRSPDSNGKSYAGPSLERPDNRSGGGDYFVPWEKVQKWAPENWKATAKEMGTDIDSDNIKDSEGPCEGKWKNMNDQHIAKAWNVFDAQGWFVMLCRHSFMLKAADMMHSGEQRKYPLALLHELLDGLRAERELLNKKRAASGLPPLLPKGVGCGYDLACNLLKTVLKSPLRDSAFREEVIMLIGILHGHAHQRICQLSFLLTYLKGVGMENLEQCERYFSKSNALAVATRHSSIFHRLQTIVEYIYHHDNYETYANLSKILLGNYKAVLHTIATKPAILERARQIGLPNADTFYQWLTEEHQHLLSKKKEPEVELLKMEYFKKLVELQTCRERLENAL